MDNLKNTKKLVEEILKNNVKTRNSDDYLYYKVCEYILESRGVRIDRVSLTEALLLRKEYELPNYETVRRTRQKCQQDNPELRASADVEVERAIREEAYREFARRG